MTTGFPHPPPGRVLLSNPQKAVNVLAISPLEADHSVLRNIFSHSKWQIRCVRSRRDARIVLSENCVPVVVCEKDLPDGTWRDVLDDCAAVTNSPVLIVTSLHADDQLWAEVLNLGGYDVLMKPFDMMEVVRVISLAWRHWQEQYARTQQPDAPKVAAAGA